jgi:hypothetical protein
MFEVVSALVAVFLLFLVAFPERFFPEGKRQTRKVGGSYWGVYEGASPDEPRDGPKVEVQVPARRIGCVAGSEMYSKGRNVSLRR